MSRDKQIEEIYNDLCDAPTGSVNSDFTIGTLRESHTNLFIRILAGHLYSKGYRKIGGLAEVIFAEIEEMLNMQAKIVCQTRDTANKADEPMISWIAMLDGRIYSLRVVEDHIAELKKKYIGEDTNVTTNTEGGE